MRAATGCCLLLLCAALLAACGRSTVVRREHPGRAYHPTYRTAPITRTGTVQVQRGDTVYGIAFRAGIDFRDLARWNGIAPPYTIYPGQRLQLRGGAGDRGGGASRPTPPRPAAKTAGRPGTRAPTSTPAPPGKPPMPTPAPASAPRVWRWPTDGVVIGRYAAGDSTRQGIDIAGRAGQSIAAAAAGTVVYSGSGLAGYGELVIVKHSDEWLSAYGHNRRRLVAEGERVMAGQAIAEMGSTGASRDMLHFEIRRNGKPLDPLPLLPGR